VRDPLLILTSAAVAVEVVAARRASTQTVGFIMYIVDSGVAFCRYGKETFCFGDLCTEVVGSL
jgi:hypothetical protein